MPSNIYFVDLELSDTFKEWRDKLNNLGHIIQNQGTNTDNKTIFRNNDDELETRDVLVYSSADGDSSPISAKEHGQLGNPANYTGNLNELTITGHYISTTGTIENNYPSAISGAICIDVAGEETNIIQFLSTESSEWRRSSSNSGTEWSQWYCISASSTESQQKIYIDATDGSDDNTGLDSSKPLKTFTKAFIIAKNLQLYDKDTTEAAIIFCCKGTYTTINFKSFPYKFFIRPFTGTKPTESTNATDIPTFTSIIVENSFGTIEGVSCTNIISDHNAEIIISGYNKISSASGRYNSIIYFDGNAKIDIVAAPIDNNGKHEFVFGAFYSGNVTVASEAVISLTQDLTLTDGFLSIKKNSTIYIEEKCVQQGTAIVTGKEYVINSGSSLKGISSTFLSTVNKNSGTIEAGSSFNYIPMGTGKTNDALMGDLSYKPVILESGGNLTGPLRINTVGTLWETHNEEKFVYLEALGQSTTDSSDVFGAYLGLYRHDATEVGKFILAARGPAKSTAKALVGKIDGTLSWDGTFTATAVYNAVWNDYAEFFPRGEETEPGDIIALDSNSKKEQYIKATKDSILIVGAHSNTYAHLIGGEVPPENENYVTYNLLKFIPVGLAGRINIKFKGKSKKGYPVTISDIPGVAKLYAGTGNIFGYVVEDENPDSEEIRLIKVLIRHN